MSDGPGTIILATLADYGIHDTGGCGCRALALQMDRAGPRTVLANLELWTERAVETSGKWLQQKTGLPILAQLSAPARRSAWRDLIAWACREALDG